MFQIEDIFGNEAWEKLQDALVDVTKLAITIANYNGESVTKHSGCSSFCNKVRNNEKLGKFCEKCDARGGFEAMRINQPFIYKCHFSIVDIAIPVVVDNKYIGAIMAGQVRLSDSEDDLLEVIMSPSGRENLEEEKQKLIDDYNKLPILSITQIQMVANMLYFMCNYMCNEKQKSIEKVQEIINDMLPNNIVNAYKVKSSNESTFDVTIEKSNQNYYDLDEINKYTTGEYTYYSEVVKKVFQYIFSGKVNYPTLKEVADNCHVSVGYLSRIFSKEVGESYSEFISKLKVDRAKNMLETSDISVFELADMLAYKDTGYFIKVFKKHIGVTPAVYRNFIRKKELNKKYCPVPVD